MRTSAATAGAVVCLLLQLAACRRLHSGFQVTNGEPSSSGETLLARRTPACPVLVAVPRQQVPLAPSCRPQAPRLPPPHALQAPAAEALARETCTPLSPATSTWDPGSWALVRRAQRSSASRRALPTPVALPGLCAPPGQSTGEQRTVRREVACRLCEAPARRDARWARHCQE